MYVCSGYKKWFSVAISVFFGVSTYVHWFSRIENTFFCRTVVLLHWFVFTRRKAPRVQLKFEDKSFSGEALYFPMSLIACGGDNTKQLELCEKGESSPMYSLVDPFFHCMNNNNMSFRWRWKPTRWATISKNRIVPKRESQQASSWNDTG